MGPPEGMDGSHKSDDLCDQVQSLTLNNKDYNELSINLPIRTTLINIAKRKSDPLPPLPLEALQIETNHDDQHNNQKQQNIISNSVTTIPLTTKTPLPSPQSSSLKAQRRVSPPYKKAVKDFLFGETLGEGSYSTVVAAKDIATNHQYAIKILDKRHIIKEKKVKYVNIEKDTLYKFNFPGIVRLYFTFQDERSLYFVLELARNGELLTYIKKLGSFDLYSTKFYAGQVLSTIEYMHKNGIIHRDLKPENILLDEKMHIKITDFGTAKILDKDETGETMDHANSFVGTAEYVSPELLTEKSACKSSDLWALGCIIFQLLAGRPPFKGSNEYQTFQKIIKLEYTFPESFPPDAKDLVENLLILNPQGRLGSGPDGMEKLKSHPFFVGIDFNTIWTIPAPKLLFSLPLIPNQNHEELELISRGWDSCYIPTNYQI